MYGGIIFVWLKSEKWVGVILLGMWVIENMGVVMCVVGEIWSLVVGGRLVVMGVLV